MLQEPVSYLPSAHFNTLYFFSTLRHSVLTALSVILFWEVRISLLSQGSPTQLFKDYCSAAPSHPELMPCMATSCYYIDHSVEGAPTLIWPLASCRSYPPLVAPYLLLYRLLPLY